MNIQPPDILYQLFPDPVKSHKIVCTKTENFLGMLSDDDTYHSQFALQYLYLLFREKEQTHGHNHLPYFAC